MVNQRTANNNSAAMVGVVGSAAAVDPSGIGAIISYTAMWLANRQLDKIEHPTTEDEKALSESHSALQTLDKRIHLLELNGYLMKGWEIEVNAGRPSKKIEIPQLSHLSELQVQKECLRYYEKLRDPASGLKALRDEVDAFVKAGTKKTLRKPPPDELCRRYTTIMPGYHSWWMMVQEVQRLRNKAEEEC
jgi:hypothetical protein